MGIMLLLENDNTQYAYIFERDPTTGWPSTETKQISANNGASDDLFGVSVAINGNYIVVGADMGR